MFIRKNKNRSGSFSIQVIEKHGRRNKVIKTFGSSKVQSEIEILVKQAELFIDEQKGLFSLFSSEEDNLIEAFIKTISNDDLRIVGPKIVLEKIYEQIGYCKIVEDDLFRHLVICRIVSPGSKLRAVDYIRRHYKKWISAQTVYRFLDQLDSDLKHDVELLTYEHSKEVLGGSMSVVFYDLSTLYFETESEDDLRTIGYSKDGKHQHPQIMIGLLVGPGGLPLCYDIYKGNTAETKTLLPFLEKMVEKFNIEKPIIVADSALLSKKNLGALIDHDYQFILGGRIKNETKQIKNTILAAKIDKESPLDIEHSFGRLIVSYSDSRAKKDQYNRNRGLKRIEAKVKTGKLTKQAINNRGYNKYLHLEGDTKVAVNYEAYKADGKWDGLKGYMTNTKLKAQQVIAHYSNLWQVEKAFRMSKSDLRFRPIYHRKENRIKAHLLICFISYAIYKELEHQIQLHQLGFSVETAIKHLKEIQEITYTLPKSKRKKTRILSPNSTQIELLSIFQN